jgi:uncharacterized protein
MKSMRILAVLAFVTAVSARAEPLVEPKLSVLVITGGHDFNRPAFAELFNAIPDIAWKEAVYGGKELDASAILAGKDWHGYDVFVFYDMIGQVPPAVRDGIAALAQAGKGLFFMHHTLGAHPDWPLYAQMMGGKFYVKPTEEAGVKHEVSGYRHDVDVPVAVVDPMHPITYGLSNFTIHDETYIRYTVLPAARPLLTTTEPTSEKVVAWTHAYGRSRVVYLQLGHDEKAYANPAFRTIVARSIRYVAARPAAPELPWRMLFDGKTLDGWEARGGATWSVIDGAIRGAQGPNYAAGDLYSKERFGDFEAFVTCRVAWPANSGIWFRYQSGEKAYQADILEYQNPKCYTGSLYCGGKMFIALNEDPAIVEREGWNTFVIRAAGQRLVLFLNGRKVADVLDDSSASGAFGIQVHPGQEFGPMRVDVREFRVRAL